MQGESMKAASFITSFALAISLVATATPAEGQSRQKVMESLKAEASRWDVQLKAAQKDVALAEDTYGDFYASVKLTNTEDIDGASASLAPLLERFPDANLAYEKPEDYCRVVRTIFSARASALRRAMEAAQNMRELADQQMMLSEIALDQVSAEARDEPLTVDVVSEAFANSVSRRQEDKIETGWGPMDVSKSVSTNECE